MAEAENPLLSAPVDAKADEAEKDDDEMEVSSLHRLGPSQRAPLALIDLFRKQQQSGSGDGDALQQKENHRDFSCVGIAEAPKSFGPDELLFSDPVNDAVQLLRWSEKPSVRISTLLLTILFFETLLRNYISREVTFLTCNFCCKIFVFFKSLSSFASCFVLCILYIQ